MGDAVYPRLKAGLRSHAGFAGRGPRRTERFVSLRNLPCASMNESNGLLSVTPVSGSPALMRYRRDENMVILYAIQNCVREAIQDEAAFASHAPRPSQWRFPDTTDGMIDLEREGLCGYLAPFVVPSRAFRELLFGFRMKPDPHHPRRNSRARTSSQGMV